MKPIKMIKKMEKQIYVAPRLKVLIINVESVLGKTSYAKFADDEDGVFLSRESIWDEDEDDNEDEE